MIIRLEKSHPLGVCQKTRTELMENNSTEKEFSLGEMNEAGITKHCADCKTSKTPMWRSGPTGPKSLCNACGIRFRKGKGGAVLGVNKGSPDRKKDKPSSSSSSLSTSAADTTISSGGKKGNDDEKTPVDQGKNGDMGGKLRVRLMGFGKELVLLQRPRSPMKRRRRSGKKKLGEVEQAAALLMTLSYHSVYG